MYVRWSRLLISASQPRWSAKQCVTDERHGVDQAVRDDQRPQPARPLPRVAEHQPHGDVPQARAEALVQVVGAAQQAGQQQRLAGADVELS